MEVGYGSRVEGGGGTRGGKHRAEAAGFVRLRSLDDWNVQSDPLSEAWTGGVCRLNTAHYGPIEARETRAR